MSYLGNNFSTQAFTPATDFFSGNGVTTTFTLTRTVQSNYAIEAVVNNVQQNPKDTYTINASNQIVFVAPPSTGTNNIYVVYNSAIAQTDGVSQGTVGTLQLGSVSNINSVASDMTLQVNSIPVMTLTQNSRLLLSGWLGTNGVTPQRQFHNLGEASFTPASNNSNIAFFNAHNATGNSGTNMTMAFRGLSNNGSVESPLAGFTVNATTSTFYGYLLTPSQPHFRAVASYTIPYNPGDGGVIVFNVVQTNVGNNYNSANGRFTAPIGGVYQFDYHMLGTNDASSGDVRIWRNGVNTGLASYGGAGYSGYKPVDMHFSILLTAGDYIEFRNLGTPTWHTDTSYHCWATGTLLG